MFEKEIKELFELCWTVRQETPAHVSFSMGNGTLCDIRIWNNGFMPGIKSDKDYMLYEHEILQKESMNNYIAAKTHLERLLRAKGKVNRDENDNQ